MTYGERTDHCGNGLVTPTTRPNNFDITKGNICALGDCSGGRGYITHLTDTTDEDSASETASFSRGRKSKDQPPRRIQPPRARKCKQQRNPSLIQSKAFDGNSNLEQNHSVLEPIAAQANPGYVQSKVRIQWPRANQTAARPRAGCNNLYAPERTN